MPNDTGIRIQPTGSATVGGAAAAEGNLIAGSATYGVLVMANDQVVRGNTFGLDAAGTGRIPNVFPLFITASGTQVGGTAAGQGNSFEGNIAGAVYIAAGRRNRVLGNTMRNNGGPAIYFEGVGPGFPSYPENDPGDSDTGVNDVQNAPVLTSVTTGSAVGTLDSEPSESYRIEVFANAHCEVEGRGEGQRRVGSLTVATSAAGIAAFSIPLSGVAGDETLTATATDAEGNTSTFSPCADVGARTVPLPGPRVPGAANGAIAWSYRGEQTEVGYGLVGLAIASMFPDGSGATSLTPGMQEQPLDTGPAWSPDGNRIAFTRCGAALFGCNVSEDVYVMNADGSGLQLVAAGANRPAWSPDGTKLAYAAQRSGGLTPTMHGIFTRPSDLSGPAVRVPTGGTSCPLSGPAWAGSTHLLVSTGCLLEGWQGGSTASRLPPARISSRYRPTSATSSTSRLTCARPPTARSSCSRRPRRAPARPHDRRADQPHAHVRRQRRRGRPEWSADGTKLVYQGRPEPGQVFREIWIAEADGIVPTRSRRTTWMTLRPRGSHASRRPCRAAPRRRHADDVRQRLGPVTSSPPGIDCPADCSQPFTRNTSVTLTATPATGWLFSGWTGPAPARAPATPR